MALQFQQRQSFTVPATSGQYAPEVIDLNVKSAPAVNGAGVFTGGLAPAQLVGISALIESNTATGAVLEVWGLKVGGDPTAAGSYFNTGKQITTGGETWPQAGIPGAQLRAKSVGVAGTMVANGWADSAS